MLATASRACRRLRPYQTIRGFTMSKPSWELGSAKVYYSIAFERIQTHAEKSPDLVAIGFADIRCKVDRVRIAIHFEIFNAYTVK